MRKLTEAAILSTETTCIVLKFYYNFFCRSAIQQNAQKSQRNASSLFLSGKVTKKCFIDLSPDLYLSIALCPGCSPSLLTVHPRHSPSPSSLAPIKRRPPPGGPFQLYPFQLFLCFPLLLCGNISALMPGYYIAVMLNAGIHLIYKTQEIRISL